MSSISPTALSTVGLLLPLLGIGIVVARYLARIRKNYGLETDDYLCAPAALMALGCGIVAVVGAETHVLGEGSAGDVDSYNADVKLQQIGIAFDILQTLSLASIKISAVFLFRRLFPGRGFSVASYFIGGFVMQWFLTFIVSTIVFGIKRLQQPQQGMVAFATDNAFINGLLIVLSAENVLVNVALFILPLTVLFRLPLATSRTFKIVGIFLFAAVAIVFGILQLALSVVAQSDSDATTLYYVTAIAGSADENPVSVYIFWGLMQMGFQLIAICLPTLDPIIELMPVHCSEESKAGMNKPLPRLPSMRAMRRERSLAVWTQGLQPSELEAHTHKEAQSGPQLRRPSEMTRLERPSPASISSYRPSGASPHILQAAAASRLYSLPAESSPAGRRTSRVSPNMQQRYAYGSFTSPQEGATPPPLFSGRRDTDVGIQPHATTRLPRQASLPIIRTWQPSSEPSQITVTPPRNLQQDVPSVASVQFHSPTWDQARTLTRSSGSKTHHTAYSRGLGPQSPPVQAVNTYRGNPATTPSRTATSPLVHERPDHQQRPSDPLRSHPIPYYNPATVRNHARRPSEPIASSSYHALRKSSTLPRRPSAALIPPQRRPSESAYSSRYTPEPVSAHEGMSSARSQLMGYHQPGASGIFSHDPRITVSSPQGSLKLDGQSQQRQGSAPTLESRFRLMVSPPPPSLNEKQCVNKVHSWLSDASTTEIPEGHIRVKNRISQRVEMI